MTASTHTPLAPNDEPLSDAQLLSWLCDHLESDDYGAWLPEVCVREHKPWETQAPNPSMAEFRAALTNRIKATQRGAC